MATGSSVSDQFTRKARNAVSSALLCLSAGAGAVDFNGTAWQQVETAYGIDPRLLYSVAVEESGLGVKDPSGRLIGKRPTPYAIRINNTSHYFQSHAEALAFLESNVSLNEVVSGDVLLDLGMFQISLYWHDDILERMSPADLLQPENGMLEAARILRIAMDSVGDPADLELQVGRYHNWKDEQRARRYGRRVLKTYNLLLEASR